MGCWSAIGSIELCAARRSAQRFMHVVLQAGSDGSETLTTPGRLALTCATKPYPRDGSDAVRSRHHVNGPASAGVYALRRPAASVDALTQETFVPKAFMMGEASLMSEPSLRSGGFIRGLPGVRLPERTDATLSAACSEGRGFRVSSSSRLRAALTGRPADL